MPRWLTIWMMGLSLAMPLGGVARAEGEAAGQFDYWVLSLSWSPNWCDREGEARGSEQCDPARDLGWVVHGLWPQYERGWPSYCRSSARNPSRSQTAAEADVFGTGGAAWYQWQKHGVCSGLSAADYYDLVRVARDRVETPEVLDRLERAVRLPAEVIEEAFLEANAGLGPDMVTVTCSARQIQEVRICLDRDLSPRDCAADVVRDCTMDDALFLPIE